MHCTICSAGLAPPARPRYALAMPPPPHSAPRLSAADALLRLWILGEVAMAGLHGWLSWTMREWPADLPGPQPLRTVQIAQFMLLFVIVPAAVVAVLRWHTTRDRPLAALGLAYGALSLWSLAAWHSAFEDGAALAGEVLRLHAADAAIALAGVPTALRALRLR